MIRSYVAIISRLGLEYLVPETEHAVPFLLRRAHRRRAVQAVCYWAVMQDRTAREVARCLQCRRYDDAFLALCAQAACFGPILPFHAEEFG